MNSMIVSTIRHAQTDYGAQHRYAGSRDVPLSDKGRNDCALIAEHVRRLAPDVIIASPLQRAMETALLIRPHDVPIHADPLAVERNYGILEGLTAGEVGALEPPVLFVAVGDDTHSVNPRGGEPFEKVWGRAELFAERLFLEHQGRHALVVAHSVFLQMLHGVFRGGNCIESLMSSPANLELATFRFHDRVIVGEESRRLLGSVGSGF